MPQMMSQKTIDFPTAAALLSWYDRHHRDLPWRVSPPMTARGVKAEPYHVWLSEVMLQQTTVPAVKSYFAKFVERWPTVNDLAAAPDNDVMAAWAGLGYYARARNLKKCAEAVAGKHGGIFPDTEEGLKALPGIGDYTAAAVAAIAFDRQAAVMDGNVERVISRLFAISTPLPAGKPLMRRKVALLTPATRPGDDGSRRDHLHAQATCLFALSLPRRLRGAAPARPGAVSGQGGKEDKAPATGCGLRSSDARWRDPVTTTDRKRPARRHDGGSDDRLDGAAGWGDRSGRRSLLRRLAGLRHGGPRLHAFRIAADDLPRGPGEQARHR
jgi:endonuclease III